MCCLLSIILLVIAIVIIYIIDGDNNKLIKELQSFRNDSPELLYNKALLRDKLRLQRHICLDLRNDPDYDEMNNKVEKEIKELKTKIKKYE
jgi:hypothetical protein